MDNVTNEHDNNDITTETVTNKGNISDSITSDNVTNRSTIDNKPSNITVLDVTKKNPVYKNLDIPSTEQARERGRKGGQKSAEMKKARKTMRESIIAMLSKDISPEILADMGINTDSLEDMTYQSALIASMLREAINGDTKAMQLVRDTIGEAPVNRTENVTEVITNDDRTLIESMRDSLIS